MVTIGIDAFSHNIVGWRATDHLRTDLALDAPEQALDDRGADGLAGLIHRLRSAEQAGVATTP